MPTHIYDLITENRKAWKKWQQNRFSLDKKHFNFLVQKLKKSTRMQASTRSFGLFTLESHEKYIKEANIFSVSN